MFVLIFLFVVLFLGITFLGIIVLGIPLAITLATPARYLKYYLLWLAMLAVLAIAWPGGAYHSSPLSQLREALEAIFLGAFAFLVVARIAIIQVIYPEAAEDMNFSDDTSGDFTDEFALGMAALTGLFAAPWSMFLVALAFSAESSVTLAHDSTFLVPIAAAALLAKSRGPVAKSRGLASETVQTFASALFASAIITLVMAAIYVNPHVSS